MVNNERKRKMCTQAVLEIRNSQYTLENVSQAAKKFTEQFERIPFPIVELAQNLGFSIFSQKLPENIGGYIYINGDIKENFGTDKIISVNEDEDAKRRRFTVAHELGHFLFDFNPNKQLSFFNKFEDDYTSEDTNEKLCNRFAAEVLMPTDSFIAEVKKLLENNRDVSLYDSVQELSDVFLTPPTSVRKRIEELSDSIKSSLNGKTPVWITEVSG